MISDPQPALIAGGHPATVKSRANGPSLGAATCGRIDLVPHRPHWPLNKPHQGGIRGDSHHRRLRYKLAASAPHHPRSSREKLRVKGEGEKRLLTPSL